MTWNSKYNVFPNRLSNSMQKHVLLVQYYKTTQIEQ